jgi:hypothetical protein
LQPPFLQLVGGFKPLLLGFSGLVGPFSSGGWLADVSAVDASLSVLAERDLLKKAAWRYPWVTGDARGFVAGDDVR